MDRISVIVTDLDRTLLRTDKSISDYSAAVLNRCRTRGTKVVFATARPIRTVAAYLAIIPCDGVIYHNGAEAHRGDELVYSAKIAVADARLVLGRIAARFPSATLSCEIDDTLYANFDVSTMWNYTAARFTDFSDLPDRPADKVLSGVETMRDVETIASFLPDDLYAQMSDGKLCMVMNRRATKQNAADAICAANDDDGVARWLEEHVLS